MIPHPIEICWTTPCRCDAAGGVVHRHGTRGDASYIAVAMPDYTRPGDSYVTP